MGADYTANADASLWRLAERLCNEMERLDPSGSPWESLSESERKFFYFSVRAMLLVHGDVLGVIQENLSHNNAIDGRG